MTVLDYNDVCENCGAPAGSNHVVGCMFHRVRKPGEILPGMLDPQSKDENALPLPAPARNYLQKVLDWLF